MGVYEAIDFYPTPDSVIEKMVEPLDWEGDKTILEPSAGSGNIADYLQKHHGRERYSRQYDLNIACIEQNADLRGVLHSKKHTVIANDFLKYKPEQYYNYIIMNPPFSKGVEHIIHAWNIMKSGSIVCLLNAETTLNPHTKNRQLLNTLIEDFGSVEYIGACFLEGERSTNVEVVIVRLEKKEDLNCFDFLFDGMGDHEKTMNYDETDTINDNAPMQMNEVKALVDVYNAIRSEYEGYFKHAQRISYLISHISENSYSNDAELEKLMSPLCAKNSKKEDRKEQYYKYNNDFIKYIRAEAWKMVFGKSNITQFMTEKVRRNFQDFQSTSQAGQFTEDNIKMFFDNIFLNRETILKESIIEAFDLMTKYHKDNRVHIEGWKTDKAWKVGKKVILPYVVELNWNKSGFRMPYSNANTINDIDKGLCMLSGKNYNTICTTYQGLERGFEDKTNNNAYSTFFDMKYYKKGSLHLTFKDEKLLERFNLTVAKFRSWLPKEM